MFHNLSYDSHFILQEIGNIDAIKNVQIISRSLEKVISMSFNIVQCDYKIVLVDTLNFLPSSLEKLTANLKIKNAQKKNENLFANTTTYFKENYEHLESARLEQLLQKGVFPYDYITCLEVMNETKLPPKEAFFNKLTQKHITNEAYQHADSVFNNFKCGNIRGYTKLYVDTDVHNLADLFETFRNECITNYTLDPAHFITAPGLSWEACLRLTKTKLELIKDPEMTKFIDEGLIGGLSYARHPHLRANNPDIDEYDPTKPTTWILLLDCNNQYGWVMCQSLPTGGFTWDENIEKYSEEYIQSLDSEGDTGYIFEVDLIYPRNLHATHDEFPLAPHHLSVTMDMLTPYQKRRAEEEEIKFSKKQTKLCATLMNKEKYKTHIKNLKQFIKLGLKVQKVHRVLKFTQSDWVKPYIDLNTNLRQHASCKAEEVRRIFVIIHNIIIS